MKRALLAVLLGALFLSGCFPASYYYQNSTFLTQASLVGVPWPALTPKPMGTATVTPTVTPHP